MSGTGVAERPGTGLAPRFPAALRCLFAGDLLTAIGVGLTQPYLVILLHGSKGVPLATATAMTSLLALASFPGNWLSGTVTDRLGGHRAMTAGLAVTMLGLAVIALGDGVLVLGAGIAGVGFGWSVTLPAYSTLIAGLVPEERRGRAFTVQYALMNVGIGAGAAAAALTTGGEAGKGLSLLWWIAAATCAAAIVIVQVAQPAVTPATREPGGYRDVVRDRTLLLVLLVAVLTSAAGYGVFNAGLPVLAVVSGDPAAVSWGGVANCAAVVAGLPLALRVGERWRAPRLLTVTAALWAAAWLVCLLQAHTALPGARLTLAVAGGLVGCGELFLAGALPSMVNALAPRALRGRYNAALTFAMTAGMWVGPMLAAEATALGQVWAVFAGALVVLAAVVVIVKAVLVRRPELIVTGEEP